MASPHVSTRARAQGGVAVLACALAVWAGEGTAGGTGSPTPAPRSRSAPTDGPSSPVARTSTATKQPALRARQGPPPPPRDPDDTDFAPAPHGQLPRWDPGPTGPMLRAHTRDRRFQLTVSPLYASFLNRRFAGRPPGPMRGFGAGMEVDARVRRWLWLRGSVSHSVHPVEANARVEDDGRITPLASEGAVRSSNFGVGLVYPLDLGPVLQLIEVGAGGLWITSPGPGHAWGQVGMRCRADGSCDPGLTCAAQNRCQQRVEPEIHMGLGADWLLGRHLSLGIHLRYYALPGDLQRLPIYLIGGLRAAARF